MSSPSRILTVDIGNTNIHAGVFQDGKLTAEAKLPVSQVLDLAEWWDRHFAREEKMDMTVVASVNPRITRYFEKWARPHFDWPIYLVEKDLPVPIEVEVDTREEVGADRLVNSYWAFSKYQRPCLIVDFGSAITIDVVSSEGSYLGGIISPGLGMSTRMLFERTAFLPLIEIKAPEKAVGKNTIDAINSGIFWGAVGMIDFLVEKIAGELGPPRPIVLATGGDAPMIAREAKSIEQFEPHITLEGIAQIAREVEPPLRESQN